jgi:hypothetical protein
MVWTYKQSTGKLLHSGKHIGTGYSGRMTNKNNPDRELVKGLGPIPWGRWHIGTITDHKGLLTIEPEQESGDTYGRGLFRMHGEKIHCVPGWASEGCIIMGHHVRRLGANSTATVLEIIR